ncbi:hypothetical protein AN926_04315 [Thermus scotoductus]|uniref:Uncharacterized protein n=1 Tax=Thermus scotoductus TaxID=37636 RepID=A0A0N1KQ98_THESC|nr:hypothetical protein AN926_04315 [Thermus scotoductus]
MPPHLWGRGKGAAAYAELIPEREVSGKSVGPPARYALDAWRRPAEAGKRRKGLGLAAEAFQSPRLAVPYGPR